MTFEAQETGAVTGAPVWLYAVTSPTFAYNLTSYDEDVVFGAIAYESTVVSHSDITQDADRIRETTVRIPVDHPLATVLRNQGISHRGVLLTISTFHVGDVSATARGVMRGEISALECDEQYAHLLVHSSLDIAMNVHLPIVQTQRLCNHKFGDRGCQAAAALITTVANVDGPLVTLAGIDGNPDGWANRGTIVRALATEDPRTVLEQVGAVLTLDVRFGTLAIGETVFVSAGCDLLIETCHTKFNNVDNFGGQPWMQEDNPTAPTGYGVVVQT